MATQKTFGKRKGGGTRRFVAGEKKKGGKKNYIHQEVRGRGEVGEVPLPQYRNSKTRKGYSSDKKRKLARRCLLPGGKGREGGKPRLSLGLDQTERGEEREDQTIYSLAAKSNGKGTTRTHL